MSTISTYSQERKHYEVFDQIYSESKEAYSKHNLFKPKMESLIKRLKERAKQLNIQERLKEFHTGVLELENKGLAGRSQLTNHREKLNGKYVLRMSPYLSSPQKIEKYAQEPLAFHLYKSRHFEKKMGLPKLKLPSNSATPERQATSEQKASRKIRKIKKLRTKLATQLNPKLLTNHEVRLNNIEIKDLKASFKNPYSNTKSNTSLDVVSCLHDRSILDTNKSEVSERKKPRKMDFKLALFRGRASNLSNKVSILDQVLVLIIR